MVRVAPIKLQIGPKVLWFDPTDIDIHEGDDVIVLTERGNEFGHATSEILDVSDELIEQLKSPLKPVLRIATEEDKQQAEDLRQKSEESLRVFKEFAAETNDDMHPVAVEFLIDGDKAVFYFEAEDRVDFRELVRRLAAYFHVRVDMRQIGVRDGARIIGGLGHCGQELCCKRLGGEFSPVSIRMAKEQNLSLNPQKISGVCGRLMCCLRYEYEAYKEVNSRAPKLNAKIELPDEQIGKVTEINVPREIVTVALEDGKTIKVPLAEMEIVGESKRPSKITKEVFEKYSNVEKVDVLEASSLFEVATFTEETKLAQEPRANNPRENVDESVIKKSTSTRRSRRRRSRVSADGTVVEQEQIPVEPQPAAVPSPVSEQPVQPAPESKKPRTRRRRSNSVQTEKTEIVKRNHNEEKAITAPAKRPGQKSSGLRNPAIKQKKANNQDKPQRNSKKQKQNASAVKQVSNSDSKTEVKTSQPSSRRRSRRRHHTTGGQENEN